MRRRGFMEAFRPRARRRALRGDEGVTAVEYGLIIAGIIVVSMGAIALLTGAVGLQYGRTSTDVGSPQVVAAPASAVPGLSCSGGQVANQAGTSCVTLTALCAEAGGIPNLAGNGCVPNQAAYCVQAGQIVNHAGTGCVANQAAFCAEVSQIPNHAGSGCVADQAAFCAEVSQIPNHAGTGCVTQAAFCAEVSQVVNHAGNGCVTPAAFCAEDGKWYNSAKGTCDTIPTCTSSQVINGSNTCVTLPAPPVTTGTMVRNKNKAVTATFDVLVGYAYGSAPYSAAIANLSCTKAWSGGVTPTCTVSGSVISVTIPATNGLGTNNKVNVSYTLNVSYPGNGGTQTATLPATLTVTVN